MREILFIRMVLCIFSRKTNGVQLNMAHNTQHHPPLYAVYGIFPTARNSNTLKAEIRYKKWI